MSDISYHPDEALRQIVGRFNFQAAVKAEEIRAATVLLINEGYAVVKADRLQTLKADLSIDPMHALNQVPHAVYEATMRAALGEAAAKLAWIVETPIAFPGFGTYRAGITVLNPPAAPIV